MRLTPFLFLLLPFGLQAQMGHDSAAFLIRDIYSQSFSELKAYDYLTWLTKNIGHRLSGSANAEKAVQWSAATLREIGLDSVWLQPVTVPKWVRGKKEKAVLRSKSKGNIQLSVLALGQSPGTGKKGVRGSIIEVQSLDELRAMPDDDVKGKIVFFNRPMDSRLTSTFSAYGGAADQRGRGPELAAEKGASAAVVRSLTTKLDDEPHTGYTHLSTTVKNIPSIAISTLDANMLSALLKTESPTLSIKTYSELQDSVESYNVIGELRGMENPQEIILVGGHLDSWDVGEGAHDDGAGSVQSMEVMYRLMQNNYKPKRTIRCVLFMNEENGLMGSRAYADRAIAKKEFHIAAIESDGGGGTAQGFGCSAGEGMELDKHLSFMGSYFDLLEPYKLGLNPGGGGADIGALKPTAGLLIGLYPDSARYFDYHHAATDVLENVHPRELASGVAAMTSLIILIDQYGIGK